MIYMFYKTACLAKNNTESPASASHSAWGVKDGAEKDRSGTMLVQSIGPSMIKALSVF